jgi:hypothetical protein
MIASGWHDHALHAHGHGGEQAGDDAGGGAGAGNRRPGKDDDTKDRQQRRLESKHEGQGFPAPVAREPDQRRADRGREQESNDRQHFAGNAFVMRHKLGARGHEAAGYLCDKQAEQAEKRVDVDIAGNET